MRKTEGAGETQGGEAARTGASAQERPPASAPSAEALPPPEPALCIVGPTASGKSALAISLAQRFNAEIISLDASQVYRGLDIGTAKVSAEERALAPHHLIDCVDPDEPFTAAEFCRRAIAVMWAAKARGRRVIICGGTGFYLSALLYGLWEAPPASPVRWVVFLRNRYEQYEQFKQYD